MQTWQSHDGKYTVKLASRAIREIERQAMAAAPNESGTPLIGYYSRRGSVARVLALGPTSPDSVGRRSMFYRGVVGLNDFFAALFGVSEGRRHYVGEWHSHPGGAPVPSLTDDSNMEAIAGDPKYCCPECILLIAGVGSDDMLLSVYVYSASRERTILRRVR